MNPITGYAVLSILDLERMISRIRRENANCNDTACGSFPVRLEKDSDDEWQLDSFHFVHHEMPNLIDVR